MTISQKKVQYSLLALQVFLDLALKNNKLKSIFVEKQKNRCAELLQKKESDTETSAAAVNEIISEVNKALPSTIAQYPLLDTSAPMYTIKGEILAFEHFLIQKLDENRINAEMQKPLFKLASTIWGTVGNPLTIEQAVKQFVAVVDATNAILPPKERYPIPHE